jgi:hypothetical protein
MLLGVTEIGIMLLGVTYDWHWLRRELSMGPGTCVDAMVQRAFLLLPEIYLW